jgi:hypothetical protein
MWHSTNYSFRFYIVLVAHAHPVLEFSKFDSELPCKMYVVLLINSDLVFALFANLQAIVFLYTYSLTIFLSSPVFAILSAILACLHLINFFINFS